MEHEEEEYTPYKNGLVVHVADDLASPHDHHLMNDMCFLHWLFAYLLI